MPLIWMRLNERFRRSVVLLALTSFCADVSSEMDAVPDSAVVLRPAVVRARQSGWHHRGYRRGVGVRPAGTVWLDHGLSEARQVLVLVGYGGAALAKPIIGLATGWQLVLVGRSLDRLATGVWSARGAHRLVDRTRTTRRRIRTGGCRDNLGGRPAADAGFALALRRSSDLSSRGWGA